MLMAVGGMIAHTQSIDVCCSVLRTDREYKTSFTNISPKKFSGAVYAVYQGDVIYDQGAGMATNTLKNGTDIAYGVASVIQGIYRGGDHTALRTRTAQDDG